MKNKKITEYECITVIYLGEENDVQIYMYFSDGSAKYNGLD